MEEENKDNMVETVEDTPEEKNDPTELITNMFNQLLTEMKTINETLNNLNPVSEETPEEETPEEETPEEETPAEDTDSEPTEEEIKAVDKLLQED